MGRHKIIRIKWSYKKSLEEKKIPAPPNDNWGLYAISRIHGNNITLLYIGMTWDSGYYKRLKEHLDNWIHEYIGAIVVSFGTIEYPEKVDRDIVYDAESGLIFHHKPRANGNKTKSYTYTNLYEIENIGYRGKISSFISMYDQNP